MGACLPATEQPQMRRVSHSRTLFSLLFSLLRSVDTRVEVQWDCFNSCLLRSVWGASIWKKKELSYHVKVSVGSFVSPLL